MDQRSRLFKRVSRLLLGQHPNNTFLSFNWHNVRHIKTFLHRFRLGLDRDRYDIVDIGAGASPYFSIFAPLAGQYVAIDLPTSLPPCEDRPLLRIGGAAEPLPMPNAPIS
jgi:hypothetical protein